MAASRHASQRGRRFLLYSSDCGLVLVRGNFSALIGRVCYLRTCFLADPGEREPMAEPIPGLMTISRVKK